jgi:lipopolysaccharide transport system ATP-binding protein
MIKNNALIEARELTVDFPTFTADRSFKRSLIRASTGGMISSDSKAHIAVRALDSLDFSINSGDRIGLYGHNGSGKTTLLRVLTGAYPPTSGYLEVHGRVASLLDISMGMDGDATGWENIILRGLMMGMQQAEIQGRLEEVGAFSGLGDYLSMPLRTYSSGMQVRLAFSVSTIIDAEILILDEWLSVGDERFQEQAGRRLQELIDKSSIMVLASHSKKLLQEICTRIFVMEAGKIVDELSPLQL